MRSLLAALSGVVAVLALIVALPIGWIATHVADEDGFVDFTSTLIDDPDLRSEMSGVVTDEIITQSGVPGALASRVRQALDVTTTRVVESPEFDTAWSESMRASHRATFDPADGRSASSQLVLDLAPVARIVADGVTADLPVDVTAPDQVLVPIGGADEDEVIQRVNRTSDDFPLTAGAAIATALFALLLARRRAGALAWLGVGTVLVAGLLHWVVGQAVPRVVEQSASTGIAARAQTLLADAAVESLDGWLIWTAIAGAVMLGLGVIGQVVRSRRYE